MRVGFFSAALLIAYGQGLKINQYEDNSYGDGGDYNDSDYNDSDNWVECVAPMVMNDMGICAAPTPVVTPVAPVAVVCTNGNVLDSNTNTCVCLAPMVVNATGICAASTPTPAPTPAPTPVAVVCTNGNVLDSNTNTCVCLAPMVVNATGICAAPTPAPTPVAPVTPVVTGGLKITKVQDKDIAKYFTKQVQVFGVTVFAESTVSDTKIKHAASVIAQYLDNDQDGVADNNAACWLKKNKSVLVVPATQASWDKNMDAVKLLLEKKKYGVVQDLNAPEMHIGVEGEFDATLEECLHLVTNGYEGTWPKVFATLKTSEMTKAMDKARGGHFKTIPKPYPSSAWYTYDDATCEYNCMGFEYFYWTLTSILGAQKDRGSAIAKEWKANTPALVKSKDHAGWKIFTNKKYKLPTKLPKGMYTVQDTEPCI